MVGAGDGSSVGVGDAVVGVCVGEKVCPMAVGVAVDGASVGPGVGAELTYAVGAELTNAVGAPVSIIGPRVGFGSSPLSSSGVGGGGGHVPHIARQTSPVPGMVLQATTPRESQSAGSIWPLHRGGAAVQFRWTLYRPTEVGYEPSIRSIYWPGARFWASSVVWSVSPQPTSSAEATVLPSRSMTASVLSKAAAVSQESKKTFGPVSALISNEYWWSGDTLPPLLALHSCLVLPRTVAPQARIPR